MFSVANNSGFFSPCVFVAQCFPELPSIAPKLNRYVMTSLVCAGCTCNLITCPIQSHTSPIVFTRSCFGDTTNQLFKLFTHTVCGTYATQDYHKSEVDSSEYFTTPHNISSHFRYFIDQATSKYVAFLMSFSHSSVMISEFRDIALCLVIQIVAIVSVSLIFSIIY